MKDGHIVKRAVKGKGRHTAKIILAKFTLILFFLGLCLSTMVFGGAPGNHGDEKISLVMEWDESPATVFQGIPATRSGEDIWYNMTLDSEGDVGKFTSIALDSSGFPHISYTDITNEALKYSYFDGVQWKTETVDAKGHVGKYTSLAIDSGDLPHISYYDGPNTALKYAHWNGVSWLNETVDSAGEVGKHTSIAMDSQDMPHICYYDDDDNDLKHAFFDDVKWNIQTVDEKGSVGEYSSMVLDSDDHVYISYHDGTNKDLKYAYFDGVEWTLQTIVSEGETGRWTSIALDSSEGVHISYVSGADTDYHLEYAFYTGTEWQTKIVDPDLNVGRFSSIALDSNDLPHISYHDYTNEDLKYAFLNVTNWEIEVIDPYGDRYTSLTLDDKDTPYISYLDLSNINLKYSVFGDNSTIDPNRTGPIDPTETRHRWDIKWKENGIITEESINVGDTIDFNATYEGDTINYNYTWTFEYFNMDMTLYGAIPNFTFGIIKEFNITLTVKYPTGETREVHIIVEVVDKTKPEARIYIGGKEMKNGKKIEIHVGRTRTLDASYSEDNVGIVSYKWNLKDENGESEKKEKVIRYKFDSCTSIKLTVTDAAGNSDTTKVSVSLTGKYTPRNLPPWLQIAIVLLTLALLIITILV